MVPTPRTNGSSSARSRPSLEVIPDERFIVFHGSEHEASLVKLRGIVRLTTPDSMSMSKPRIRLEGRRKISWYHISGLSSGELNDKNIFWNEELKLGVESTHKIKAGVIEWPFEFELSPSMPESVEGLRDTYVAWGLCANVSRPGWNSKDLVAQQHIRIVRTLGPDSMDTTRSRVNSDIWANKVSYSISIPTDAIVFGTSITADVELSPLKKGLRLGKIELRLLENVVKRFQIGEFPDSRGDRMKSEETEVANADMDFPEHSRVTYNDETVDNPTLADEMYRFKAKLPLPKSLNRCRQDVDSHQINVTHRFKLMVNIHNPEGHISQLVCRLPVKIFISPNLPVDESNEVHPTVNGMSDEALNSAEVTSPAAPPEYGRHQLDQLFSDMDPAGFLSGAPSNRGSPSGPGAESRRDSGDQSPSLNGVANGLINGDSQENQTSVTPSMLRSRLTDLQERGSSLSAYSSSLSIRNSPSGGVSPAPGVVGMAENQRQPSVTFQSETSSGQPAQASTPGSRRTSDESVPEVRRNDYDMDNLARVPSYGAALRTNRFISNATEGPPSYIEATSRPPTPTPPPLPALQRPDQVHTRNGADSPASQPNGRTLTNSFSPVTPTTQTQSIVRPPRSHRGSIASDDEARIRMLRART